MSTRSARLRLPVETDRPQSGQGRFAARVGKPRAPERFGRCETVDSAALRNGSLFLTRPSLGDYTSTREELLQRANEVLDWVQTGQLKLHIGLTLPLAEAAEAHRQLEGRQTTGKILLMP